MITDAGMYALNAFGKAVKIALVGASAAAIALGIRHIATNKSTTTYKNTEE